MQTTSNQREQKLRRHTELVQQISTGEQSLLASTDDRTRHVLDRKLTAMRNELRELDNDLNRVVQEPIHDFMKRHGNDSVQIGGNLLFGDGAQCNQFCTWRSEPPTDAIELLKLRRQYIARKLALEEKAFQQFRDDCLEKTSLAKRYGSPSPPSDAPQQLERGKAVILKLRQELAEVDCELAKAPETTARRARQQMEREHRERLAELENRIAAVQV